MSPFNPQRGTFHRFQIYRLLSFGDRGCGLDRYPDHYWHTTAYPTKDTTRVIGQRYYLALPDGKGVVVY